MTFSIIDQGRRTKEQAKAALSSLAAQEGRREAVNTNIEDAEDAQDKNTMGTAAGMGFQKYINSGGTEEAVASDSAIAPEAVTVEGGSGEAIGANSSAAPTVFESPTAINSSTALSETAVAESAVAETALADTAIASEAAIAAETVAGAETAAATATAAEAAIAAETAAATTAAAAGTTAAGAGGGAAAGAQAGSVAGPWGVIAGAAIGLIVSKLF